MSLSTKDVAKRRELWKAEEAVKKLARENKVVLKVPEDGRGKRLLTSVSSRELEDMFGWYDGDISEERLRIIYGGSTKSLLKATSHMDLLLYDLIRAGHLAITRRSSFEIFVNDVRKIEEKILRGVSVEYIHPDTKKS